MQMSCSHVRYVGAHTGVADLDLVTIPYVHLSYEEIHIVFARVGYPSYQISLYQVVYT